MTTTTTMTRSAALCLVTAEACRDIVTRESIHLSQAPFQTPILRLATVPPTTAPSAHTAHSALWVPRRSRFTCFPICTIALSRPQALLNFSIGAIESGSGRPQQLRPSFRATTGARGQARPVVGLTHPYTPSYSPVHTYAAPRTAAPVARPHPVMPAGIHPVGRR